MAVTYPTATTWCTINITR